jgi:trans-aconitate methyltransferase
MTFWDERYASVDWAFGTEPNDFLRDHVTTLPTGPVLCIGDGEGRNGVFVATHGHQVTSVDLSSVGLAKAQQLAADRGVELTTQVADLADFDPGVAQWSAVVSIFCHVPSALRAALYPRLVTSLVPGGVFLLESYTPDQIGRGTGGPSDVDLMSTPDQLQTELMGLDVVHLWHGVRDVVEGPFHSGGAAVVQFIGRRPA